MQLTNLQNRTKEMVGTKTGQNRVKVYSILKMNILTA